MSICSIDNRVEGQWACHNHEMAFPTIESAITHFRLETGDLDLDGTYSYESGAERVVIVLLPCGRAGELMGILGEWAVVRPWDQSAGQDYRVSELRPWLEENL